MYFNGCHVTELTDRNAIITQPSALQNLVNQVAGTVKYFSGQFLNASTNKRIVGFKNTGNQSVTITVVLYMNALGSQAGNVSVTSGSIAQNSVYYVSNGQLNEINAPWDSVSIVANYATLPTSGGVQTLISELPNIVEEASDRGAIVKINRIKSNSSASGILDLLRFLAALSVFSLHATANPYMPGHQAVIVFFVLSGYFVGTSVLSNFQNERWSWREYLVNRLTRLWIVLIPALVLTALWCILKIHVFGTSSVDGYNLNIGTFLGNVLFLQGAHVHVFGNNGPLWSLSYEFWYYMLFPCIVLACLSKRKSTRLVYIIITLLFSLFVYKVLGARVLVYFPIWLFGVLPALMRPVLLRRPLKILANTAIWLIAVVSLWISYSILHEHPTETTTNLGDFVVGVLISLLLYVIISSSNNPHKLPTKFTAVSSYLAGFSYTLYLVHYPALNFMHEYIALPVSVFHTRHLILRLIIKASVFVGFILYAWFVSLFTEAHTNTVRNIFRNRYLSSSASAKQSV